MTMPAFLVRLLCLCLLTALVRSGEDDSEARLPFEPWLHTHLHRQHRVMRRHIREHQRLTGKSLF